MKFKLTDTQLEAAEGIAAHLAYGKGVKTMCGYAGSGKTTLLIEVYKRNSDITFLCPTHKAKGVLVKKLLPYAPVDAPPNITTVTAFLKDYKGTKEECITQTIEMLELGGSKYISEINKWKRNLEKVHDKGQAQDPVFADKEDADAEEILCDEASMISRTDRNDIELRCRAAVMVGDGFQAAPVVPKHKLDYEDWFFKAKHDWALTEVHRNDAGVLTLATMIRELNDSDKIDLEKVITDLKLPDLKVLQLSPILLKKAARDEFMFLSFMNKIVDGISFSARRALKRPENTLTVDDRLFAGNSFNEITNKSELKVPKEIKLKFDQPSFGELVDVDTGIVHNTMINPARLLSDIAEHERRKRSSDKGLIPRFDLARTIHGSQGSEWKNVVFRQEGMGWMDNQTFNRLVYTAVTRAQQNFALAIPKK